MNEAILLLTTIAAGQGIFLCLVLLFYRGDASHSTSILGLLFFSFTLQLTDFALLYSQIGLEYPHFVFLGTSFNLAFGPLIYFYIQSSKNSEIKLEIRHLLHLIPFVLHLVYSIVIYHSQSGAYKVSFIKQALATQAYSSDTSADLVTILFASFVYVHIAAYMVISRRHLLKKSDFGNDSLRWLKKVWTAILIISLFGLVQFLFLSMGISQQPYSGYVAASIAIGYIYYSAVIVIRKPDGIFNPRKPDKYHHSSLSETESTDILRLLRKHMTEQETYKSPDLTLKSLASQIEFSDRHISQVINEQLGQNFHDFLNEYRVNEFKKQLQNPENNHLNLFGIALNCGFNSKSSFNTAFKRFTGQTPSQFKAELQKK